MESHSSMMLCARAAFGHAARSPNASVAAATADEGDLDQLTHPTLVSPLAEFQTGRLNQFLALSSRIFLRPSSEMAGSKAQLIGSNVACGQSEE